MAEECRSLWRFWRDRSPTFPRQEYLLPSASTCKTGAFSLDRLCGLPESQRLLFGKLLEHVQGSKGNEKKEKEQRMRIYPIAWLLV